jgi:hypothetical protein
MRVTLPPSVGSLIVHIIFLGFCGSCCGAFPSGKKKGADYLSRPMNGSPHDNQSLIRQRPVIGFHRIKNSLPQVNMSKPNFATSGQIYPLYHWIVAG